MGFSRQTIYIYISILKIISAYESFINRKKAVEFGHKKMRHFTEGVNAVKKTEIVPAKKEEKIPEIFENVKPEMASTEIEAVIEDIVIDNKKYEISYCCCL